ncbi:MAG: lysophospholipid acyltransferase family protein [Proteobacteria bacterium]|nr:lysophospholipid acyltransferase family protein [Pseudomonadota bacterium]
MSRRPIVTFRLNPLLNRYLPRPVTAVLAPALERLLALRRAERVYAGLPPLHGPVEFAQESLRALGVRFRTEGALAEVAAGGPLIVVANHPFGGIEGLYLYTALAAVRPDVRVLGNELLARLPEFAPALFAVDVLAGTRAVGRNGIAMRQALRHLGGGGALLVFPAGEVAALDRRSRTVVDPPWHASVARLVRLARAPVVPVFVGGSNSPLFHAAGLVHPRLRTALLPRELFNKGGRVVPVRVGRRIEPGAHAAIEGDEQLCEYLRLHVYALACAAAPAISRRTRTGPVAPAAAEAVAAPAAPERLAAELGALDVAQRIAANNDLEVWHATAEQAPWLLQEIGRLRELTFRTVGEGTGRARDIDLYDSYYEHLFVWNRAAREVVGGYRIGAVDRIYARYGTRGLYTHTLFDFHRSLLPSLGPALEIGRSFVRPQYQRSFAPLMLLWKGIAAYLVAHPQYRVLFGPVSISNDYSLASRALITGFLRAQSADRRRARLVRARNPVPNSGSARLVRREAAGVGRLDAVESVVASLEPDGKGVPVLLRQYLKLGAEVLGFNVDPAFGNAIDVLVAVDLERTDPRVLAKYMGREGAATWSRAQVTPGAVRRSGPR